MSGAASRAAEAIGGDDGLAVRTARFARRRLLDRAGRAVVTLGGGFVILSILAILLVLVAEVLPLLRPATATAWPSVATALGAGGRAMLVDEYRSMAAVVGGASVETVSLADGRTLGSVPLPAEVRSVSPAGPDALALGLADGRVLPVSVAFRTEGTGEARRGTAEVRLAAPVVVDPLGRPVRVASHGGDETQTTSLAAVEASRVVVVSATIETSLLGESTRSESRREWPLPVGGEVTALAVDDRGDHAFAGTSSGEVVPIDLRRGAPERLRAVPAAARPGAAITRLGFLLGGRTLVAGDASGGVSSWQLVPAASGRELVRMHAFEPAPGPVTLFSASRRHKGFWTGTEAGDLAFHYGTTGETLLRLEAPAPLGAAAFAPKADGVVALGADGRLLVWDVHAPHPEVTLRSLFGEVWYEGYPAPAYVWQSTGGTDDFEPKLSLTPLLYGTLKGTFYALVFAVPVALLGALYTSQFLHPRLKAAVKPTVELLAAVPSVVLGFLAGLWLAPRVETVVPGIFLAPVVTTAAIVAAALAWRALPETVRARLPAGMEIFLLVPVVAAALAASFELGALAETHLLGADARSWLSSALGVTYDQRNSIVVGLAMGFAVIPVVFTISEDSLSNVPPHLTAGSLALGATRWQTAVRVVLPSASPGIFSAVMIGFGRAVGETMIVLMATGNTPLMDASIFNGFRALSANIAVELPEAPEGGTLFRVLFVAALLLFALTFALNTVAEIVRLRLRERYRTL